MALLVGPLAAQRASAEDEPRCTTCPTTTVAPAGGSFSGTLVLPGPGGSAQPIGGPPGGGAAGGCGGCSSTLQPACGNGAAVCVGPNVDQCLATGGQPYYVLFFSGPGDTSGDITSYLCLRPGQRPVPLGDVTGEVRRFVDELVPRDPRVVVQPRGGALVRTPTLVRADMATAPLTRQFFTGSGFAVTVTATPVRWAWTFGEGAPQTYGFPGAAYDGTDPVTSGRHVTHTYATPGTRQVQVTVTWTASYTVAGLGTVDAGAVDRPSVPVQVDVKTARTELVAT